MRLLTAQPITRRGMQVKDHGKVEPSFSGPHIAYVTGPLLVRLIRTEVLVQQARRDVEGVVAVGRYLVFLRSLNPYSIFPHQTPRPTVADVQAKLLQLFGHSGTAIAAQAEPGLLLDVG